MRIAVMGAGAVGGYYGSLLAQAGNEVTLVARGPHLAAIQADGLRIYAPTKQTSKITLMSGIWDGRAQSQNTASCLADCQIRIRKDFVSIEYVGHGHMVSRPTRRSRCQPP